MNDPKGETTTLEGQGDGLAERIEALVARAGRAELAALEELAEADRSFGERTVRRGSGG